MNQDRLNSVVLSASSDVCAEALLGLLSAHASPVFGAAKAVEHEIAALRALQLLELISGQPDEYELVMALRITRAKARSLLYQAALRSNFSSADIREAVRSLLCSPRVCKDGDKVLLEVPDPLLMDCLRQRIRQIGYIADGSFSGTLAKISASALAALINDLLLPEEKRSVRQSLLAQGVPGDDLSELIMSSLAHIGQQVAGAAGEKIAEKIGIYLADYFVGAVDKSFQWARLPR